MTYPSNPHDYPSAGAGEQPGYSGAPGQGYPSQAGNPGAYPPQAPYPPQPGAYPPAYAPQAPSYPPQPGYAPPGYPLQPGYPPQPGYGHPYAQAQMPMPGASPFPGAVGRPKAQNPLATRALVYGALSLGANIVGLFIGFYLTGIAAAFTIYYSIRALVYAGKLPGKEGTGPAIAGLVLALLSLLISLLGYVAQFRR